MLELKGISKYWDDFSLRSIDLAVNEGEYFVVLGLSGAGKSVLLEMIAGLVKPDDGQVLLDGVDITNTAIAEREVGVVFQDYAIFPHKSVLANIIYPLRNVGKSRQDAKVIACDYASKMGIEHLLHRMPDTLSGGELQRVALARTLVLEPKYLLLDEPLSAVDVQLQEELKALLRRINREGITVVHVTHSYEEALSLADRVAIVQGGQVLQVGTAKEVFHTPKSSFVASLSGVKNFYNVEYLDEQTALAEGKVSLICSNMTGHKTGYVMLRAEDVLLSSTKQSSSAQNQFKAMVVDFFPCAIGVEVVLDLGIRMTAYISSASFEELSLTLGSDIWASFKSSAVRFIPHE